MTATPLELFREPPVGPGAVFSPCRRYRYSLSRVHRCAPGTGSPPRHVTWILLNPSTADEREDDATLRRVRGFSIGWLFDELTVVNAYALRSTDPRGLWAVDDPVGPDNDAAILAACARADLVVCGWGLHLRPARRAELERLLAGVPLTALELNRDGSPAHPLRLARTLKPKPFFLGDAP